MGTQIGLLNVRRSAFIQAPPARVWQEFQSFDRIRAWLGLGHELHSFEPRVGGAVDMSVELDGKRQHYGGKVLVFERDRELTFESNWAEPAYAWPVPTLWTIRLTPLYDGTHVELFHHGFERLGADAADNLEGYETGWDVKHLKALRELVGR
jgi:uncharacterized protein YndB with AHSA1/START domain